MTIYDRREVLGILAAVPLMTAYRASAIDKAGFPLWIIDGGKSPVYLLGHTPPRSSDWSDARIERLLTSCGSLWHETAQNDHEDAQDLIQRYGVDPKKPLSDWLSAADKDRMVQAAKMAGVPPEALSPFRPWLAGQALEGAFFGAPGVNGQNADAVLTAKASETGLGISSEFATKADAARWFSEFSAVQEVQYLRYILDEILAGHAEGQRIYADWAMGDAGSATAWVARMKRLYPELYRSIVTARNQNWAARVQIMLRQEKPTMTVVGFYHLVGPDSIQHQLQAARIHIERM